MGVEVERVNGVSFAKSLQLPPTLPTQSIFASLSLRITERSSLAWLIGNPSFSVANQRLYCNAHSIQKAMRCSIVFGVLTVNDTQCLRANPMQGLYPCNLEHVASREGRQETKM